jgi:hypothetical protein
MSLKKIIRKNIEDNAVTEPKLANEAVTAEKLSTDFVTGLTELSEQAANDDTLLIYDTSAGALKKVSKSNTTVLESPVVSSVSPTSVVSDAGLSTFTITGTGFTAGSNARLIGSNGRVRNFATVTRDSTTQLTATINVTTDMAEAETPYGVQVINGTGLNDLLASQIDIDQYPVFVTSSGSLGSGRFSMSGVEVNATDPDSAGNITFELQSGSLPPGISLVNTAANGGTATFTGTFSSLASSDTIYNFTLRAVDAASNTSSRAFSFTQSGPQYLSFTSTGTFSVPTGLTLVDVLVVGGGGGAGNDGGGGGGAGGLVFVPQYPVTPGGTVSVTVGCGGSGGPGASQPEKRGTNGQDSVFGTITAKGGGGGGGGDCFQPGLPGGSGGGGGGNLPAGQIGGSPSPAGSATQPTQPGQSGAYGFGNPGGCGQRPGNLNQYSGGGGGAGVSGQPGPSGSGGGDGKAYTIADGTTPVYYAGGGGGSNGVSPFVPTPGGQGGGGPSCAGSGTQGQANTGGGGGGPSSIPSPGSGGKGIVIVKY